MFLWLIARAFALFTPVQWRLYAASVIGRNGLRNPYGARRSLAVQLNRPTQLAKNDSKARALLVNVQLQNGAGTASFASSQSIGQTEYVIDWGDPDAPPAGQLFVLAPDDQLFVRTEGFPQILNVGQEWY